MPVTLLMEEAKFKGYTGQVLSIFGLKKSPCPLPLFRLGKVLFPLFLRVKKTLPSSFKNRKKFIPQQSRKKKPLEIQRKSGLLGVLSPKKVLARPPPLEIMKKPLSPFLKCKQSNCPPFQKPKKVIVPLFKTKNRLAPVLKTGLGTS